MRLCLGWMGWCWRDREIDRVYNFAYISAVSIKESFLIPRVFYVLIAANNSPKHNLKIWDKYLYVS